MTKSEGLIPEILNVALPTADTEYVQPLPRGTKHLTFQLRTSGAMRFAFETGKVATPTEPYATVKAGGSHAVPEKVAFKSPESRQHVWEVTIADTWAKGDTIVLTAGGESITVTIGSLTTTDQVATTLKQAWEGETLTDKLATVSPTDGAQSLSVLSGVTATVAASVVTFTHDTAGHDSELTVTATTAGDGTAVQVNTISAYGNIYLASPDGSVTAELIAWKDIR